MANDLFRGIDPTLELAWEGDRKLGGDTVSVWVWASEPAHVSDARLGRVEAFVRDMESFDARARALLTEDLAADDSSTALYLEHHLEVLDEDEVREVFGRSAEQVDAAAFFAALRLVHVGIRPARFEAVFDYSIGRDLTQYVLAVTAFIGSGEWRVEMES